MRNKSGWRLLLTGTPLQNNLQELVVCHEISCLLLPSTFMSLVPYEFYPAGLISGLPGVTEGSVQGQGRFQGHPAGPGACFPCEKNDGAFRLAPEEGPGMYPLIVMSSILFLRRLGRC